MVIWWDVKRSLSTSIFLVLGTFIMLVGYGDVRFSLVAVEATLEKTPTAIRRGAITEYNSSARNFPQNLPRRNTHRATQHAGKRAVENFEVLDKGSITRITPMPQ
uniref:Uncharacterized protein n=1 Tax=Populus trichocarpa TaxID=3694 RepID=B9GF43_POPTR